MLSGAVSGPLEKKYLFYSPSHGKASDNFPSKDVVGKNFPRKDVDRIFPGVVQSIVPRKKFLPNQKITKRKGHPSYLKLQQQKKENLSGIQIMNFCNYALISVFQEDSVLRIISKNSCRWMLLCSLLECALCHLDRLRFIVRLEFFFTLKSSLFSMIVVWLDHIIFSIWTITVQGYVLCIWTCSHVPIHHRQFCPALLSGSTISSYVSPKNYTLVMWLPFWWWGPSINFGVTVTWQLYFCKPQNGLILLKVHQPCLSSLIRCQIQRNSERLSGWSNFPTHVWKWGMLNGINSFHPPF